MADKVIKLTDCEPVQWKYDPVAVVGWSVIGLFIFAEFFFIGRSLFHFIHHFIARGF